MADQLIDPEEFARQTLNGPDWESLKRYLDDGDYGTGWPPSAMLVIGTCVLLTGPDRESPARAVEFYKDHVELARQRWRAGFYANPFAAEPKRRAS